MNLYVEVFCGVGLGVEYCSGDWIGDEDFNYFLVEVGCFRLLFSFNK